MIDGVIKYKIVHQNGNTPEFSNFKALENVRHRLFSLGLIGQNSEGIGYGNLSMRHNGSDTFFITATQTGDKSALTQEFYTHVKHYDFETFTLSSQGAHKPSSEALSHAMIYNIHPEINTVIHIHSLALWDFMIQNGALHTSAAYGTEEMVHEIASLYEGIDPFKNTVFVMQGHQEGVMSFGRDIDEAESALYKVIGTYLDAQQNCQEQ
jgi:ribulose-5-phosphate 4-epimerase/fuculose-1-phosphate aldolase